MGKKRKRTVQYLNTKNNLWLCALPLSKSFGVPFVAMQQKSTSRCGRRNLKAMERCYRQRRQDRFFELVELVCSRYDISNQLKAEKRRRHEGQEEEEQATGRARPRKRRKRRRQKGQTECAEERECEIRSFSARTKMSATRTGEVLEQSSSRKWLEERVR